MRESGLLYQPSRKLKGRECFQYVFIRDNRSRDQVAGLVFMKAYKCLDLRQSLLRTRSFESTASPARLQLMGCKVCPDMHLKKIEIEFLVILDMLTEMSLRFPALTDRRVGGGVGLERPCNLAATCCDPKAVNFSWFLEQK